MQAIILAGGLGTRLKNVVPDRPKPMAIVGGRPFLEYLICQLRQYNVNNVILSVGYKSEMIIDYFKDGKQFGVNIDYCIEDRPLGTGGAIKKSLELFSDEYAIVLNGDSICEINLEEMALLAIRKKVLTTIGLVHVNDTARYGSISIDNTQRITAFNEKGKSGNGYINSGYYIINRNVFNCIVEEKFSFETEILMKLINTGMMSYPCGNFFIDIGIPEDYILANERLTYIKKICGIEEF